MLRVSHFQRRLAVLVRFCMSCDQEDEKTLSKDWHLKFFEVMGNIVAVTAADKCVRAGILPHCRKMLVHSSDPKFLNESCQLLSNVVADEIHNAKIFALDVVPRVVELLKVIMFQWYSKMLRIHLTLHLQDDDVVHSAMFLIMNFSADSRFIPRMLECNCLQSIVELLGRGICRCACMVAIYNILEYEQEQVGPKMTANSAATRELFDAIKELENDEGLIKELENDVGF